MRNTRHQLRVRGVLPAALAALIVLPFAMDRALAQRATASVSGSVADASGATVPSADVSVRNLSTNTERSVMSNDLGYYVFTALPAGSYSLTVKKPGFQT